MSFVPTTVRSAEAQSEERTELAAAAEASESVAKLEGQPSLRELADATSNEPVQYLTRRERREAERAAQAQARVDAFSESLRAAKAVSIAPAVPAQDETDEVEIPESFRAQWQSSRTRASRMFAGRRVSGSTVALGLMAGTVVVGTGSVAAFAAGGTTEAANLTATVSEETVAAAAPDQIAAEDVAVTDAQVAVATAPKIEATSVTTFDSAMVAGIAVQEEVVEEAPQESTASAAASGSAPAATTASAAQAGVVWPVGEGAGLSSYFGPRSSPTAGASSWHEGVDFVPGYGAPVGSMAAGTVVTTDFGSTSYGYYIDVEHTINGQTITTRYAHLSSINVSVGQSVSAGETIGNVGNTGVSTGAHLHFEVHVNGAPTDPLAYLQSNA